MNLAQHIADGLYHQHIQSLHHRQSWFLKKQLLFKNQSINTVRSINYVYRRKILSFSISEVWNRKSPCNGVFLLWHHWRSTLNILCTLISGFPRIRSWAKKEGVMPPPPNLILFIWKVYQLPYKYLPENIFLL